jgi:galactoside 2-L-fucosyltransferase 1/2
MTCQLHGRIGNMMFAYASLVGIARRNARTPALPTSHFLRAMFRLRAADMPARVNRRESVKERHAGAYDDRTEWIDSDADLVEMVGYYQSWKYFARVVDEIRREFVFQAEYQKAASKFLRGAIGDKFGDGVDMRDVVLVGVHVRVADMASNVSTALGYTVAPPAYLSAAMDYFKREYPTDRLMFVLATDDLEWCSKHFPYPTDVPLVRTGRGPDVLDLAILSYCNHTILTVGTFGWWAGWLTGGKTLYYKNFPRPDSSLASEYGREDYYPSDWIGM